MKKANNKIYAYKTKKKKKKEVHPVCDLVRIQRPEGDSIDPDEVAHNEPPHLDLSCWQMQLCFIFCTLKIKRQNEYSNSNQCC